MHTIFAPITGRGGAVTVIRLSGAAALQITAQLTNSLPPPRHIALRKLRHNGELLDSALVTIFPAPNSYTGEDCVELSLHGGRAVLAAISNALTQLGARFAEPGEFSRRAYANNRLDLLQAEAIADLIAAETESQRRLAIGGAETLQTACATWRETLRHLIAQQEALIDFPDEDLPPQVEQNLRSAIETLRTQMQQSLQTAPNAERLREGLEFVILGPPNAGKSTLLNALAGADIAIVSHHPGTTRDTISVKLDLAGIPVHLTDTAGLRATSNPIETAGISRAQSRAAAADLILNLAAPGQTFAPTPPNIETLQIHTKADLAPTGAALSISAQTGQNLPALLAQLTTIAQRLTETTGAPPPPPPPPNPPPPEPELRAEDLRTAATALARLTGTIGTEEVLDAVFNSFCIGK